MSRQFIVSPKASTFQHVCRHIYTYKKLSHGTINCMQNFEDMSKLGTRSRWHSIYVRSVYKAVQMKSGGSNFFWVKGLRPITPQAGDPCFCSGIKFLLGLPSQYVLLNTNQAITLANTSILGRTDTSLLFFQSPKMGMKQKFSKPFAVSSTY